MNRTPALRRAVLLCGMIFSSSLLAQTFVYISAADDGAIARYALNEQTGALHRLGDTPAGGKVMPMALSPDQRTLYAAVRSQPVRLVSWSINSNTGALTPASESAAAASYPFISLDRQGRFLLAASYDGGVAHVYRLSKGGKVVTPLIAEVQTGHGAHSVITDATNRSVYVGVLGRDRVLQFSLHPDGQLTPIGKGFAATPEKGGARHSVISPDNRFLYNIGEMSGGITQFARQPDGALQQVAEYPSAVAQVYHLQPGVERTASYSDTTPRIWAADIKITPDGRFLYATERTSSTVTGYRIEAGGKLRLINHWPVEKQPRGIAVSPDGRWLIVSGEKSAVTGSYAIDRETGALRRVAEAPVGRAANWVTIVSFNPS
ncbi:lactonase family protein [Candidatus Pantoea deserta]|uniref:Lactonase family protein n=1 Tax=Candidatus Pantoea deserta TaxID=1869313 RepID=A0A3N4NX12_9GAMM|nr:beta-propeller fold lactonase family protein [Pantoea deserta]RPD96119.1 lactonase family protein [Pantoea deserta]